MKAQRSRYSFIGSLLALCLGSGVSGSSWADDLARGAEVYRVNCATCHGPTGAPAADSELVKSLGVMPANFADPLFNSREPASTWKMVIIHGGPAMGFSEMMPAFGATLSEQDIDNVLAHIKTLGQSGGGEHGYPDGSLNLFLPIRTKKAFPEDEWVWKQRYTGQDGDNAWKNTLEYEFRVGKRGQGVLEVTHEIEGSQQDFGHFEPGFKYVLRHDTDAGFILTGAAQVGVPLSSDADWEFLPYLAFGKILSEKFTLQGSGRLVLDLEDSDKSKAEFAGIVHFVHTDRGRAVFPALELVAEVPFERGNGPNRAETVQWSVIPQARIGLNKRGNIALNTGVELPLNDDSRYDWRVYVYFIWDFADGGLFDGW